MSVWAVSLPFTCTWRMAASVASERRVVAYFHNNVPVHRDELGEQRVLGAG